LHKGEAPFRGLCLALTNPEKKVFTSRVKYGNADLGKISQNGEKIFKQIRDEESIEDPKERGFGIQIA